MKLKKFRKALAVSLTAASLALSTTACNSAGDTFAEGMAEADSTNPEIAIGETTAADTSAADAGAVTDPAAAGNTENTADTAAAVETDADGNPLEPQQSRGRVALSVEPETEETKAPVPIQDTDLGEWTKTKNGFMFRSNETGEWVASSMMTIGDYVYYFDENGLLQDNVFIPTDEGTKFISGYQFITGFIELDGEIYYITPDEGRAELCKAQIDGELWCFDEEGRAISEEEWDEQYGYQSDTSDDSESTDETSAAGDKATVTTDESLAESTSESVDNTTKEATVASEEHVSDVEIVETEPTE